MRTITAQLKSISPYSQSRMYDVDKLDRELHDAYEKRTWRERLHVDKNGEVFIPPMAIKNALSEAAKYMSLQIPGKGKATYTKHIEAGILITSGIKLGIKKDDVPGDWLPLHSDGRRGGSKRVKRCMPRIDEWEGSITIYVLDEILTLDVVKQHMEAAGNFIGIGRFRPRNNGYYGRFEVVDIVESA